MIRTILPGLSQLDPPDVMRGEETQIAGVLARYPDFAGVICLPGTHTKWASIAGGQVQRFQTFLTGELFALLSAQSILRLGLDDGWDNAAFAQAVAQGLADPARTSAALFSLRANGLLNDPGPGETRSRLSGLLIGLELAGARDFWTDAPVIVVGDDQAAGLYAPLTGLAGEVRFVGATDMTRAGLISAYSSIIGTGT